MTDPSKRIRSASAAQLDASVVKTEPASSTTTTTTTTTNRRHAQRRSRSCSASSLGSGKSMPTANGSTSKVALAKCRANACAECRHRRALCEVPPGALSCLRCARMGKLCLPRMMPRELATRGETKPPEAMVRLLQGSDMTRTRVAMESLVQMLRQQTEIGPCLKAFVQHVMYLAKHSNDIGKLHAATVMAAATRMCEPLELLTSQTQFLPQEEADRAFVAMEAAALQQQDQAAMGGKTIAMVSRIHCGKRRDILDPETEALLGISATQVECMTTPTFEFLPHVAHKDDRDAVSALVHQVTQGIVCGTGSVVLGTFHHVGGVTPRPVRLIEHDGAAFEAVMALDLVVSRDGRLATGMARLLEIMPMNERATGLLGQELVPPPLGDWVAGDAMLGTAGLESDTAIAAQGHIDLWESALEELCEARNEDGQPGEEAASHLDLEVEFWNDGSEVTAPPLHVDKGSDEDSDDDDDDDDDDGSGMLCLDDDDLLLFEGMAQEADEVMLPVVPPMKSMAATQTWF